MTAVHHSSGDSIIISSWSTQLFFCLVYENDIFLLVNIHVHVRYENIIFFSINSVIFLLGQH